MRGVKVRLLKVNWRDVDKGKISTFPEVFVFQTE